jgi:hypothetical protein
MNGLVEETFRVQRLLQWRLVSVFKWSWNINPKSAELFCNLFNLLTQNSMVVIQEEKKKRKLLKTQQKLKKSKKKKLLTEIEPLNLAF